MMKILTNLPITGLQQKTEHSLDENTPDKSFHIISVFEKPRRSLFAYSAAAYSATAYSSITAYSAAAVYSLIPSQLILP